MDLRESKTRGGVRHPWERARFAFLARLLSRHARLGVERVLDVGSGDAWLATRWLEALPAGTEITCVDAEYTVDVLTSLALPAAITARTTMPEATFPLVLALDVAEHVEDDAGFVASLVDCMEPGATLLFTVPAWPGLYSQHDRRLGHHRRYTHAAARALLERSGLRVLEDGGFFHSLVAPRVAALLIERLRGEIPSDAAPETAFGLGETAARVIAGVLEAEQRLTHALGARGLALLGLSYYALAVREAPASTQA